jgi:diguanylate cyclase (GGDEF)-like protein
MSAPRSSADSRYVDERDQLRQHVARVLQNRAEAIVNAAVPSFPFAGVDPEARETAGRVGDLVLQLLMAVTRDGEVDPRCSYIVDLRRIGRDKRITIAHLFSAVAIAERAALDELTLDEPLAMSRPWPAVAQIVRQASFDALAAFAERLSREAGEDALNDTLTTLHTRQVLLAALDKEIRRCQRFRHRFALILFDVDRLTTINAMHGFGFGDRLLERIGIVLRNYFREQDWVCRSSGDKFAVLLPETVREHAELLAERVRVTVEDRMALRDYRTDTRVPVTLSVGLLIAEAVDASVEPELLLREAEQAAHRAKHGGRNRVERVEINVRAVTPRTREVAL